MLVRSLSRISRTNGGVRLGLYPHPHPQPQPHPHAFGTLHTCSSLHHALSSLPLLSCHSFRMLYSSSVSSSISTSTSTSTSASTSTSTSTSTSSTFPFVASRYFPVRSFSTEGPKGAGAGADAGAGSGAGAGGAGTKKQKTWPKMEPGYGDAFKDKFGAKKLLQQITVVIKWGSVLMFTYYALTDHANVEGEAWYMTILLKPYRTVMAMFPGDDSILIPAETPDQFGRRTRTLVVNWENVLVSSDWSRCDGWEVRQRPGLDQFLARAYKAGWEIVVFCTATQEPTEQHILRADPTGGQIIKHRIFYEGTSYRQGFIIKDLTRLGRDLERVIAVDHDMDMYRFQRANFLKIKKFIMDKNDKELEKLADFLENLSRYNVHDVRPYIAKYNANPNDPAMFAEEEQARIHAAERLRKAKRSLKYTGAADTTTTTTPKSSTNQPEKEEQGWLGWVKGITGVFSRS